MCGWRIWYRTCRGLFYKISWRSDRIPQSIWNSITLLCVAKWILSTLTKPWLPVSTFKCLGRFNSSFLPMLQWHASLPGYFLQFQSVWEIRFFLDSENLPTYVTGLIICLKFEGLVFWMRTVSGYRTARLNFVKESRKYGFFHPNPWNFMTRHRCSLAVSACVDGSMALSCMDLTLSTNNMA